jgi:hypothetical protein
MNRHGQITGESISPQAVVAVVAGYGRQLGFNLKPHDQRRTCAKLCRAGGGELEQIQCCTAMPASRLQNDTWARASTWLTPPQRPARPRVELLKCPFVRKSAASTTPAGWKLRLALLEAAGHRCQYCGRPHRLLNVAHLSHDPADQRFLAVLCPRCHSRNDTPQRLAMTRRTRAQKRGQLWLAEEIRLAPFPLRIWPVRLRQMELF